MTDPASLENLRDIAELAPVSMWPRAVGWKVLGLFAILVVAVFVVRWIRQWHSNAYRRAALRELETLSDTAAISRLLKRVALVAFPRAEVASLSGDVWCRWLSETSGVIVDESVRKSLVSGAFEASPQTSIEDLVKFTESWIQKHERKTEC